MQNKRGGVAYLVDAAIHGLDEDPAADLIGQRRQLVVGQIAGGQIGPQADKGRQARQRIKAEINVLQWHQLPPLLVAVGFLGKVVERRRHCGQAAVGQFDGATLARRGEDGTKRIFARPRWCGRKPRQ